MMQIGTIHMILNILVIGIKLKQNRVSLIQLALQVAYNSYLVTGFSIPLAFSSNATWECST